MAARLPCLRAALVVFVSLASANVEKTIFAAPAAALAQLSRDHLCLETLTPLGSQLTTALPARFPTAAEPRGPQSWFLLDGLSEAQRHEVRVCWAATQPTDFWLDTFTLDTVSQSAELATALADYSTQRREQQRCPKQVTASSAQDAARPRSLLLLRIHSAADYFTTNKSLLQSPPNVHVDIVLDPFLLNVLPQSLLPTAGFLVALAILGWYLSGYIWVALLNTTPTRSKAHAE